MVKSFIFDDYTKISANCYLIVSKTKKCVLIDCSTNSKQITNYIDENRLIVSAILLTHAHFDHIRGVDNFLSNFNYSIPVYLNNNDKMMLLDPYKNSSILNYEKIICHANTLDVVDNQILNFDDIKIKVIHTPFHTKGSVCYLYLNENVLFTGDSLFKGSIGRTDLENACEDKMKDSLRKIKSLGPNYTIYCGHGDFSNLDLEKRTNPYLLNL